MTYRVAFAKRFQSDGNESRLDPTAELDVYLPDGVVADKMFVSRFDPEAKHNQDVLDEDDAFLGLSAAEVWEYTVLDEHEEAFLDAVRSSQTVMEFEIVDETTTDEQDIPGSVPLADGSDRGSFGTAGASTGGPYRTGSGVRSLDDGPGGQPTADTTAGEMTRGTPVLQMDEVDGIATEGSGLDDLNVVSEGDPRLGLTAHEDTPASDWAADTGATRVPDRGIVTSDVDDDASTLAPER